MFKSLEKEARWYVYELADPDTLSAFYVGKGSGNRIDQHERDAEKGGFSRKTKKILEIKSSGKSVVKRKIASFWCEQAAYDFETDQIAAYGLENLTNVLPGGQKAWERRQVELESRRTQKEKVYTDIDIWEKEAGRVAYWLIHTSAGTKKLAAFDAAVDAKLKDTVRGLAMFVWNEYMPNLMRSVFSDSANWERAASAVKKYGVELVFPSKVDAIREVAYG